MAEQSTIARPYAEAAFAVAQADGELQAWSDMLHTLSTIVEDPSMQALIGNTSVDKGKLVDLVMEIADKTISEKGRNFTRLLAENRRLLVLPEIAEQFDHLKADAEKTIEGEIVAASPVSEPLKKLVADKLKASLGREVKLVSKVDESLLGGAIIKAGDLVIDGSVRAQLEKLSVELAG